MRSAGSSAAKAASQAWSSQLGQAGLGDTVSSWVATGPNKPVDPNALGAALGPDKVQQLPARRGLDVGALLPVLAAALPTVIDAITPDGQVPKGNAAAGLDVGGVLAGLSRGRERGPELAAGAGRARCWAARS